MAYITSWYWNKGDFRKVNEDSFTLQRVRARKKELIFAAVCDGIGGLRAGECASGLVAEQLTEWFYREGFWKMRSFLDKTDEKAGTRRAFGHAGKAGALRAGGKNL